MSLTVPMYGFGGGGSGSELNFDVKDFRTEAELLATAGKENRIGVITSVPMTGWRFDANQPEDLQEGEVWFFTGTTKNVDFNALRKNGIQIYPISAKQHISGALMDCNAKIYQNSLWTEWWNGELYYNGCEYENLTGGWSTFNHHSYTFDDSKCTKSDGKLTLKLTGSKSSVAFGTEKAVDLTDYTSIEFTVEEIYSECAFAVSENRNTSAATNTKAKIVPNAPGVHSLDISKISGGHYVWFGDYSTGAVFGAVVSKIRLVK